MSRIATARLQDAEFSRVQSSSSINTFRQCPRKYYYHYVLGLETRPSIHLIRGKVAHSVLEDFFDIDISRISEQNFDFELKIIIHDMLSRYWKEAEDSLAELDMDNDEIDFYLAETKEMVQFWLIEFIEKLNQKMKADGLSLADAFDKLKPVSEEHFLSKNMGVQGYIDAIHKDTEKGDIKIIDYKTSKRDKISDDYRLQLAIYALLYHERYGEYPGRVGLFFLKHGERLLDVDDELLEFARTEVEKVHRCTTSKDMADYPRKESFLCKWSTGQCDFYERCSKDED